MMTLCMLCTAMLTSDAAVAPRRVRQGERVHQHRRHHPGHVHVVQREHHAVRHPVTATERALHPRQQEPAEEELLTDDRVEHGHHDDHREPAPAAVQHRAARVRAHEQAQVAARRRREAGQQLLGAGQQRERHDHPPHPAAAPPGLRTDRCAQPQRLAQDRPAQRPLLVRTRSPDVRTAVHASPTVSETISVRGSAVGPSRRRRSAVRRPRRAAPSGSWPRATPSRCGHGSTAGRRPTSSAWRSAAVADIGGSSAGETVASRPGTARSLAVRRTGADQGGTPDRALAVP